jgi:hypothetical protein
MTAWGYRGVPEAFTSFSNWAANGQRDAVVSSILQVPEVGKKIWHVSKSCGMIPLGMS